MNDYKVGDKVQFVDDSSILDARHIDKGEAGLKVEIEKATMGLRIQDRLTYLIRTEKGCLWWCEDEQLQRIRVLNWKNILKVQEK